MDKKLKSKLELFNDNIPNPSLRQYLLIDEVGGYSITKNIYWEKIKPFILEHIPDIKDMIVTDCFASAGGDTINFGLICKYINSIELDRTRYYYLLNNIAVYQIQDKVTCYNNDFTKIIDELEQDIIYLDPPFGGPDYYKEKDLKITINGKDIMKYIEDYISRCKYLIAKLPFNYKISTEKVNEKNIYFKTYNGGFYIYIFTPK